MHLESSFVRTLPIGLLATGLLVGLAGCGDLNVQSIPPAEVVPAALAGVWIGTWTSNVHGTDGAVEIRIQEFAAQPVINLVIDNPCLQPRSYDLELSGSTIALRADGEVVLQAELLAEQELDGSYSCASDEGRWRATRVASLPAPIDLSGSWSGRIIAAGAPEQRLDMSLLQTVEAGVLVLRGMADLPGAVPFQLPVSGYVEFREQDFELVLRTMPGYEPKLVLSGLGERETLQIPAGMLRVLSPMALPFSQATVALTRL